jgi:hypothetical protein
MRLLPMVAEDTLLHCCRNSLRSSSPASKCQTTNRASTTPVSFGGRERQHRLDDKSLQFVWISRNASLS